MNKKSIATIILFFISIGILVFITADLWNSVDSFKKSKALKKINASIPNKIQVVTSFYPIYFFSQQIGGNKINIYNITPFQVSPQNYQPTPEEVTMIENSNLVILNGLGLESWSDNIQDIAERKKITAIFASGNLNENQVIESEKDKADPHIWLSPLMAKQMVDKILDGFLQADSNNLDYYKANANKLKLELDKIDAEYRNGLIDCQNKSIITSYPAFLYLGKEYGLNQITISGLSSDVELSSQQLANISDFVRAENTKYIFFEKTPSLKLSETIEEKTGAKILILNPIESLSKEEIKQGKNYFTEMRSNLDNLKIGLDCQ